MKIVIRVSVEFEITKCFDPLTVMKLVPCKQEYCSRHLSKYIFDSVIKVSGRKTKMMTEERQKNAMRSLLRAFHSDSCACLDLKNCTILSIMSLSDNSYWG